MGAEKNSFVSNERGEGGDFLGGGTFFCTFDFFRSFTIFLIGFFQVFFVKSAFPFLRSQWKTSKNHFYLRPVIRPLFYMNDGLI